MMRQTPGGPIAIFWLALAPLTGAAVFSVWARITTVQLGYDLSEAAATHQRLVEENRALRLEVAALKAPARLERLAKEYRLAPAGPDQMVHLTEVGW